MCKNQHWTHAVPTLHPYKPLWLCAHDKLHKSFLSANWGWGNVWSYDIGCYSIYKSRSWQGNEGTAVQLVSPWQHSKPQDFTNTKVGTTSLVTLCITPACAPKASLQPYSSYSSLPPITTFSPLSTLSQIVPRDTQTYKVWVSGRDDRCRSHSVRCPLVLNRCNCEWVIPPQAVWSTQCCAQHLEQRD